MKLLNFESLTFEERKNLILTLSVAANEVGMNRQSFNEYLFDITDNSAIGKISMKRRMPSFKIGGTKFVFRDVLDIWKNNWEQSWSEDEINEIRNRSELILTIIVAAEEINMHRQQLSRYVYDVEDENISINDKNIKIPTFKIGSKRIVFKDDLKKWLEKRKNIKH